MKSVQLMKATENAFSKVLKGFTVCNKSIQNNIFSNEKRFFDDNLV